MDNQVDCIFYFNKQGYNLIVPDHFIIVERSSEANGIAVRKDLINGSL